MATKIFTNSVLTGKPGSYSEVDTSALEGIGLSASGIIAVIGEAIGGIPVSEIEDISQIINITKPEQANQIFKSGNLREAIPMLFNPSNDPNILGGAQQVIAMKVNPSTGSSAQFENAYNPILLFTSRDYGDFTNQINIEIGTGTTKGKLLTISYEDEVEVIDDLGGDVIFNLSYVNPTNGWDVMSAEIEDGGAVVAKAIRENLGLDGAITQLGANSIVKAASSSTSDITQQVVVYGLSSTGAAQSEALDLNGTDTVDGTLTFSKIFGARIVGTIIGTVTVTNATPTTILTISPGINPVSGLLLALNSYVANNKITIVADNATTKQLIIIGKSTAGVTQLEVIDLTGATPVVGVADFSEINYFGLGDVEVARTITFSCEAARTNPLIQNTLTKVANYFNGRYYDGGGFVFTVQTTLINLNPSNLDTTTGGIGPQNCLSPANPSFYSDVWFMINWINNSSQYIFAEKISAAIGGSPNNTTSPVYLLGGGEGTTTTSDWQAALNLLKQVFVNTIVPLTGDPAIHAMLDEHISYMCGIGKKERDGLVGLMNTGLTDTPTKAEIKAQIMALNSRNLRAFAQYISKYNTFGELTEFPSYFLACICAGMQAGSPIGTSLTRKYVSINKFRQSNTWNPGDDCEDMLDYGLCFLEYDSGKGYRIVRNLTTHLMDNNLAYIEASVNEALNYFCYNFRTNMEYAVGKPGFAGTLNAAYSIARAFSEEALKMGIITAYRSLNITLVADYMEVSIEVAPIIPINFVKSIIHVVMNNQSIS
jgi:hypothetical protein